MSAVAEKVCCRGCDCFVEGEREGEWWCEVRYGSKPEEKYYLPGNADSSSASCPSFRARPEGRPAKQWGGGRAEREESWQATLF